MSYIKFKQEFCGQAEKLCLLGATDKDLADFFQVAESTINAWKIDHPKFKQALKNGKEIADMKVADSLFKKAIGGHKIKEVTFEKVLIGDENIEKEAYKKKVVEKEIAPDSTAQIFWLKNRQPSKWRDKQEIQIEELPQVNIIENLNGGNI